MTNLITDLMNNYGYLSVLLLIAIENIFPPIPSEVILCFGGFMCSFTSMEIIPVIIVATLGSIFGAIFLYYVGSLLTKERLSKFLTTKVAKYLGLKQSNIDKAFYMFNKHGRLTVFLCRFVPIVRSLISIPAGMAKMAFLPFIILTSLGSLIWNTVLVLLGDYAGSSWDSIVTVISNYSSLVLLLFIIIFIILVILFFYKKRSSKVD